MFRFTVRLVHLISTNKAFVSFQLNRFHGSVLVQCFIDVLKFFTYVAGVEVSVEEIKQTVNEVFEENKATIVELRYRTNGRCSILHSHGIC